MRRGLLSLGMVASLGACTVGPDYHLPETAAIRTPSASAPLPADGNVATAADLPPRWWHLYDDPVLDRLEQEALDGSTDLREAAANLQRARAVTAAAEGASEPDFEVEGAAERARLSGETFLLDEALPVATLGDAGLSMRYQFDLFGRVRRSVEAAKAGEEARQALLEAVKVTLAGEVARAYVGVCSAHEGLELAERAVSVQEAQADAVRRMHAAGRLGATEVTAIESRLAAARARLPEERTRIRASLYRLAFLLGRAPADYPREAEGCTHLPRLARPLPAGDGASLLARRPDIRAAERELAAATARIGVATADLYPQIGFGLSAGSSGFLSDLGEAPANRWSIGSLIHWSFPGAGARARVRAANAEADAALARFDGVVLSSLREAHTALDAYAGAHDRSVELDLSAGAAQRGAEQVARLRQAGRAAALPDLDSQTAALAAQARAHAGREAVVESQITLFMALGGGW